MVTVPEELAPPTSVVGLRVTVEIVGASTVRGEETVVVPLLAEMLAVAFVAIWEVVTVKVPDEAPVAIVRVPGTWAAALVEPKVRVMEAGAAPDSVTVAVEVPPPRTLEGDRVTPVGIGASMVRRIGPSFTPNALAEMCEMKLLETGWAVIWKVPVVEPEGTDMVAGTVTVGAESEANATVKPAGGAAALIVIVPVIGAPP